MENNENLEKLLEKSAKLLLWHEQNQTPYFKTYFNKHFSFIRSSGYFVCCEQINDKSIEVYFRAAANPIYRTKGYIINNPLVL